MKALEGAHMTYCPTPPIQGYMLEVAATRLTPEKLALLNYKLATGSPTAAQIMACIKPGEWESATGDTRQFNDIRLRLEAAIDAWIAGDPQSKGFVWTPQTIKLNLTDAAAKLSKLTTDSTSPVSIIRAGAAGQIPVHWFNDLHQTTYISDFTSSPPRDLRGTDSSGPLQLNHTSLRELIGADSLAVFEFHFTDQDFALLEKIKGKAVDDDGNLLGYRHPATKDGTVTITRDQLFVFDHDLKAYAATLTPNEVAAAPPTPKAAAVDQEQTGPADLKPMSWSLKKPPHFKRYNEAVYKYLKAALDEQTTNRPTASDMVDSWHKAPIAPIIGVADGIASYWNSKGVPVDIGKTPAVTLENIRKVIGRMTTKNKP